MKLSLKRIMVLQAVCFALWLVHSFYLNDAYGAEQHRLGVESGMVEYQSKLRAEGIKRPPVIPGDVPFDKEKRISGEMDKLLHDVFVFWPACIIQVIVIVLLAGCFRKYDEANLEDENETEQVAASDR